MSGRKKTIAGQLADIRPEIAVNLAVETIVPAGTLVADYLLTRLTRRGGDTEHWQEVSEISGSFARAVTEAKDYEPAAQLRFDLGEIGRRLQPSGVVYLVQRHKRRKKSTVRLMAEMFAEIEIIMADDGLLVAGREPRNVEHVPERSVVLLDDNVAGRAYELETWPGVFSSEALDSGTAFLIDNLPDVAGARVLDVGCGYGPLSIVVAGRGALVRYLDVDARALRLTAANLNAHGLTGVRVKVPDLQRLERGSIDLVVSNPPTHAGSDALQALFRGMVRVLAQGGQALIVVRRQLNYEKWLSGFARFETASDDGRYKIIRIWEK